MKLFLSIFALLVLSSNNAISETWQATFELPASGSSFSLDMGVEVLSITGISVRSVGSTTPRTRTCDSAGGQTSYPVPYVMDLTIEDSGEIQSSKHYDFGCGSTNFDLLWTLDNSDPTIWSYLLDGAADLMISFQPFNQSMCGSDYGYCYYSVSGSFSLETLTITIDYEAALAGESKTWEQIKSIYR